MNYITDKEIDRLQGDMGRLLAAQPKVTMLIKDTAGDGAPWEGGINGYFFRIPRGVQVELPRSIAELIRLSGQVEILGERKVRPYKGNRGRRMKEAGL